MYGGEGYSPYPHGNTAGSPPTQSMNPSPYSGGGGGGGNFYTPTYGTGAPQTNAPVGGNAFGGTEFGQSADWNAWAPPQMDGEMVKVGGNMAKSFLDSTAARYQPGVFSFWKSLKILFAVNNKFVMRRLRDLMLPILKKDWKRTPAIDSPNGETSSTVKYMGASVDDNAPDLYIPLMAFITYVLVMGFIRGKSGSFTPEVLIECTTAAVLTHLLETGIMKFGLHLLGAPASFLDLYAYTGYKFVALCINMLAGIALGTMAYYGALLYTGCMMAYFIMKVMANSVPIGPASRELLIIGFVAMQLVVTWFLGESKNFSARHSPPNLDH
eukprot:402851_1